MHIISTKQFDRKFLSEMFKIADSIDLNKKHSSVLKNKIMATLFYEPSTRTRFSFESAMFRLGGQVISTENAKEFSSVAKGETLEDSIKVINNYADVIVLRHYEEGAAKKAADVSTVPLINAGDGAGEHPTQALLDLYTIYKKFKKIDGLSVALCGDLKYSRTVRSLVYLLDLYKDIKFYFVSPAQLKLSDEVKNHLNGNNIFYEESENLLNTISRVDVLYQTRVQKERFESQEEYLKVKDSVVLHPELLQKMKKNAVILHPLPRNNEVPVEIDKDSRAVYFEQTRNGLIIRMALLRLLLTKKST